MRNTSLLMNEYATLKSIHPELQPIGVNKWVSVCVCLCAFQLTTTPEATTLNSKKLLYEVVCLTVTMTTLLVTPHQGRRSLVVDTEKKWAAMCKPVFSCT